ncbi:glucose 1-dehydrogenase [Rhypophila decipiens]|uniref:Glucose 1-dehydrogenase n=1 Tax=Rhypophila decipiens TaxID=261697 RepID=A0AAN6YKT3_9PEZI|nr:glucose 1-dehydrogenase [Rhypophila decipiens]
MSVVSLQHEAGSAHLIEACRHRLRRRMRIAITIDFDAISGYLGTGHTPQNTLSDYSAGLFSANVGVDRVLRLLAKHGIAKDVTWFIPGHSMESFPRQTRDIIDSGAEIGLHGYSHEGAPAMALQQERDVLDKCIDLAGSLLALSATNKHEKAVGYRAPLYQIRESTIELLQEKGFLYDSSLNGHDSLPYLLPRKISGPGEGQGPKIPDYTKPASTWMVPFVVPDPPALGSPEAEHALVEIPGSWYTEDLTPLGYYPYSSATQGYVSVEVVEKMWWDRFEWLWENECNVEDDDGGSGNGSAAFGSIFPLIWHPEGVGRSHVIGMVDRFLSKLVAKRNEASDGEVTFDTMQSIARDFKCQTDSRGQ